MDHETSFSVSRNDICSAFGFKISFSVTLSFAKVIMFKFYQLLTEKLLINFASNVHRCLRLLKSKQIRARNVYATCIRDSVLKISFKKVSLKSILRKNATCVKTTKFGLPRNQIFTI